MQENEKKVGLALALAGVFVTGSLGPVWDKGEALLSDNASLAAQEAGHLDAVQALERGQEAEEIQGYRIVEMGPSCDEIYKTFNSIEKRWHILSDENMIYLEKPALKDPKNIKIGKVSQPMLDLTLEMVNLFRRMGGYPPMREARTRESFQAYCVLSTRANTLTHAVSTVINHPANKDVPDSIKNLARQAGGNHSCLAGFDFINDVCAWMDEGYENGLSSNFYDIGHRMYHLWAEKNIYYYGRAGALGIADQETEAPFPPVKANTPYISTPGGQIPTSILANGAALTIDFRGTEVSPGADFTVEVYVPDAQGKYDISAKPAATYTTSNSKVKIGSAFWGTIAFVQPPWQDPEVLKAQGITETYRNVKKPIFYGLILRNVETKDKKLVNVATRNLFSASGNPSEPAIEKPAVKASRYDSIYAPDPSFLEKYKAQVRKYAAEQRASEQSTTEKSTEKPTEKPTGQPTEKPTTGTGKTQPTEPGHSPQPGSSTEPGGSTELGHSSEDPRSTGATSPGSNGSHKGSTNTPGYMNLSKAGLDPGLGLGDNSLAVNPKHFWTLNAGRLERFLHRQGLDKASFEQKYKIPLDKVLDQYAESLVSAEDLEDLMQRLYLGPYAGEDYMLSLSRALQATGYSYYSQFNLMDWSTDYSNIYGLTPEADPMAEWRMNPIQYVIQTDVADSTPGGDEVSDGQGDRSHENRQPNRRTRQTEGNQESIETQVSEPAQGKEAEEPTAPAAVETAAVEAASEGQAGPTTIPAQEPPKRRQRGTAPLQTSEETLSSAPEQTTESAGN